MGNASSGIAMRADELNIGGVDGQFLRDDTALRGFNGGFGMFFNLIDALDDDLIFIG